MKIGDFGFDLLKESVVGLRGKHRRRAIKDLAGRMQCSEGHLYRLCKRLGVSGQRSPRKDAGTRHIKLAPEVERFMKGLTLQADLSADAILFITARHFGLAEDFMSTATYNSWLRRERISRRDNAKDLRPYRAHLWRDKANALHQYDTTVALAFYANDDGSIGCEPGYQRYKNKPGNRRPRLHLYSLTDYFSSVIFARFYFSENSLNLLDFVFRAWSQKDDPCYPFYGLPAELYCDQGSPQKSAKFVNAAKKLEFNIVKTDPAHWTEHGSRKFGRVERTFGEGLLKEFMKITKIYRFTNIDELNACLYDWLIRTNNKVHSTHGETRFARWLRTVGTPRSMPSEEMFKLLHYDRAVRTVASNLQIHLNGKIFQLPHRKPFINWVDCKVEVYWYPGHEDIATVVYDFHEEEVRALAPVVEIGHPYANVPITDREELVVQIKQENYSTVNFPDIYKAEKTLRYLPRKGVAFDETKIAEKTIETAEGFKPSLAPERWFSIIEAKLELQRRDFFQRPPSAGDVAWLADLLHGREKISETELEAAVKATLEAMEKLAEGNDG